MTLNGHERRKRKRRRRRISDSAAGGIPSPAGLDGTGVTSDINMTPMIDVMMALLIIFMVVTPVLTSYAARLPTASNVVPETEDEVIELGVDQRGNYWIGEQRVPAEQLEAYLSRVYAVRPGDHLLYLRADRGIDYARILDAVDAARAAGVRRVGAITEPVARQASLEEPGSTEDREENESSTAAVPEPEERGALLDGQGPGPSPTGED